MKKSFLLAGVALLALASCSKQEQSPVALIQPGEMSFVSVVKPGTKGYLVNDKFYDVTVANLHAASGDALISEASGDARKMNISAYLHPQDGKDADYFRDYVFATDGAAPNPKWHHTPAIYWPVGGTLDFLAYSVTQPFQDKDVEWNETNASEDVVINVHEDKYRQDDIAFCSAYGVASSTGATSVAMEFKHSQAWLQIQVRMADEKMKDQLAIESIVLEDVYTTGYLTLKNNNGSATAAWNYRHEVADDLIFDDLQAQRVYGSQAAASPYALTNALDENTRYMDMLLPEQNRTSIVIHYVLAGQPNKLTYRFDLDSSASWLMGEKYVYAITFTTNEITVAPTVKAYEAGAVSDLDGALI